MDDEAAVIDLTDWEPAEAAPLVLADIEGGPEEEETN